ncbi:uncharacterized protein EV154DRAFT_599898 [Mucor mucedo]|uniref:uncharacterized protein n=1 Tax=Mucor mucedo TaxID=29922 RepID=UPI00221FA6B9|nr:uncharacterized protein EV154DRAFT_599898 [Mucor mucedo]KAI7894550.1 hypothetical protein EV154DRAFT_599898 [Mucor mucedo]
MSSRANVQMRARRSSTGSRSGKGRRTILLRHACYICGGLMSNAGPTLNHLYSIHGYDLPSRERSRRRPQEPAYEYVRDPQMGYDEVHLACPSCWFHCPDGDLDALCKHTQDEHDPVEVDMEKRDAMMRRPSRSRSNSVTSTRQSSQPPPHTTPSQEETNETKQIAKKLAELTELFQTFFKK